MESIDGFILKVAGDKITVTKENNSLMYEVIKNNYVKSIGGIFKGIELEHHTLLEGSGIAQNFKAVRKDVEYDDLQTQSFIYDVHTALFKAGYLTYMVK